MVERKDIDVRNQVTLSFEKSMRFCLKGISYRMFRSSLTLAVVVVAVAFFTVLLSEGLMVSSTSIGVSNEMQDAREADRLLMHLFQRYSSQELSGKLAAMVRQPAALSEFARVTSMPEPEVMDLVEECRVEQQFLRFFRGLSAGKRVVLARKNTGRDVFEYLLGEEEWKSFLTELDNMRSVRLPMEREVLRSFLNDYRAYLSKLEQVRKARIQTVIEMEAQLAALTGKVPVARWLGEASADQIEKWRKTAVDAGFDLDGEKMARVREILRVTALEDRISTLLQTPEKREEWKVSLQSTPGLEEKLVMLKDEKVGAIVGSEFSAEQRAEVTDRFARLVHLRALMLKLPVSDLLAGDSPRFLDGRQLFLVIISFLVCMVGVTNAMLMSITERFREIATMKCLGATDGFILKQFLIEAAIQGLVGGTCGMLIGMAVSILKSSIILGSMVFTHFPGFNMFICAIVTVVIGVILAMLASIYPARAAATMAPMDAMRVE